jgi:hypothetical protein
VVPLRKLQALAAAIAAAKRLPYERAVVLAERQLAAEDVKREVAVGSELRFYGTIEKMDKEGRRIRGYCSTEALDSQGDVILLSAMKAALPSYMRFANIREMHQPSAVGVARSAEMDGKGVVLDIEVVDPAARAKVASGVYKGLSVGGRVRERAGNTITAIDLVEVSLVDRPANPECVFEVWKAAGLTDNEDTLSPELREYDRRKAAAIAALERHEPKPKSAAHDLLEKAAGLGGLDHMTDAGLFHPDLVQRVKLEPIPDNLLPTERVAILATRSGLSMSEVLRRDASLSAEYQREMLGTHPLLMARREARDTASRGAFALRKAVTADGPIPLRDVEITVGGDVETDEARRRAWVSGLQKGMFHNQGVVLKARGTVLRPEDVQL